MTTGQFQKKPTASSAPIPFSTGMFRSRPFPTPEVQPSSTPDREPFQHRNPDYNQVFGVQPKLTVGAPNDKYEQEADRVAEQVMSMADPVHQPPVQRQLSQNLVGLQTKPSLQQNSSDTGSNLESQLSSSKGGGSPLPDEVRSFMEPRLGYSFQDVRVHTNSEAVQMNRDLNAQAFTHGSDIYFGAGKSPAVSDLTAHELTHVVQQTGGVQTKENEGLIQKADSEEEQIYTPADANMSTTNGTEVKVDSSNQLSENSQNVTNVGEITIYSNEAEEQNYTPADANLSTIEGTQIKVGTATETENLSQESKASSKDQSSYADEAYGIMNSSQDPYERIEELTKATNKDLEHNGVPSVTSELLPGDSPNLGEGHYQNWSVAVNPSYMSPENQEGRADAANTVAHEAYHLNQWYQMARLQAGRGNSIDEMQLPADIATQAAKNPILQSDEQTYQVQQWYESVYGKGADYRQQVLNNEDRSRGISIDRRSDYCKLPEERDAWDEGMKVTERFRQIDGTVTPPLELDPSVCDPKKPWSEE